MSEPLRPVTGNGDLAPLARRVMPRSGLAPSVLGFGAATLGNLYQPVSDGDARAALDAALDASFAYVDTAPHYGHGLSERRVGDALRARDGVILSSKVGRLLHPDDRLHGDAERNGFRSPVPFDQRYDYTHDGILRSWEDSLQRLGLARIDILYVHDIGPLTHGADHLRTFDQLTKGGGLRALEELRLGGGIAAFGVGVNEWQICLEVMEHADLDVILLAGRYTLLEQESLVSLLPRCVERQTSVVIGGAYNSGILATGTRGDGPVHYDYGVAPPAVVARVARLERICDAYGVALPAAALQFPLAHPAVVSVIPGMGSAARVRQTLDLYRTPIPDAFWTAVRDEGLIRQDAPLPSNAMDRTQ
ncbi:aldo/keto reductase [Sphingomonas sp.]|uniref:aldo/keto reductase n=1 Tax=Sphingomonas sp. TaxID=28214 RepID=UPI002EDB9E1A